MSGARAEGVHPVDKRALVKKMIPAGVRRAIAGARNVSALRGRFAQLEGRLGRAGRRSTETSEEMWERSRRRWREALPVTHLTWGKEVSGDAFILKADAYGAFGPDKRLLEIGPGYGRLLKSLIKHGAAFKSYAGVDLSAENVRYLRETFAGEGFEFVHGDVESVRLEAGFDVVMSSLTFKHLFPSFRGALGHLAAQANPGCLFLFDLIEGVGKHFEHDGITYIRSYTRPEVSDALAGAGLKLVAFDEVRHDAEHARLLVVARK
jgi:SAM-dependent methyltransferase